MLSRSCFVAIRQAPIGDKLLTESAIKGKQDHDNASLFAVAVESQQ